MDLDRLADDPLEYDDVDEIVNDIISRSRTVYIRPMFELIDDLHGVGLGKAAAKWPIPFDGDEITESCKMSSHDRR